jgi:hypothetical protein
MTGDRRHDDAARPSAGERPGAVGDRTGGDALDRLIDEAVESMLDARRVDLRATVLARIDASDSSASSISNWSRWLVPVAGVAVIVLALGVLLRHTNQQIGGGPHPLVARQAAAVAAPPSVAPSQAPPVETAAAAVTPTRVRHASVAGQATTYRRIGVSDHSVSRVFATSWLEMDAMSGAGLVTGASVLLDEDPDEEALPGAPAGELGDPIAPMPKPRPIAIRPIATPPIANAPTVATLGRPLGALVEETARESKDAGKPGGR